MVAKTAKGRAHSVQVRLNDREHEWLTRRAESEGVGKATYLRMRLRAEMAACHTAEPPPNHAERA